MGNKTDNRLKTHELEARFYKLDKKFFVYSTRN